MDLPGPACDRGIDISAFAPTLAMVNMSGTHTAESFENFVWESAGGPLDRGAIERVSIKDRQHVATWQTEPVIRAADDAGQRLEALNKHGNSDWAFARSHLPEVKLWQARCA